MQLSPLAGEWLYGHGHNMELFYLLIALKVVLLGALYGRLDGGGIAKVGEWVERSLIMFFFVLACAPFSGLYALLSYGGVGGIATGHGQYFLNRMIKAIAPERFDFIVRWFFGTDPRTQEKYSVYRDDAWRSASASIQHRIDHDMMDYGLNKLYWRNVFGMFVTGSLVGIPAFIISMCFGQWIGAVFLLTGVVKSIAYMVGYRLYSNTESSEYINGGLRNVICLCVMGFILLG